MTKPLTFQDAFPGRFLTAGHFDGRKVTLTISDVYLDAELDKKKPKLVAKFAGKTLELVVNKSNAYCIKEMFGNKLTDWVGRKITFFPTTTMFGEDVVECIRVWGSPDIAEDKPLKVPQGRKKPIAMTMHAIKVASHPVKSVESVTVTPAHTDQDIRERWDILGWTEQEGEKDLAAFAGPDDYYLGHLSALIDQQNAQEAS